MSEEVSSIVPRHIGFIVDGNRRWAKEHDLPIYAGHKRGYYNLEKIAKEAHKKGVEYVSAYVFSSENWRRERSEVRDLMRLLKWILKHEVAKFHREGVRLRVIGSKLKIGKALLKAIHDAEKLTEGNERGTLLLCLDYGGQQEIVDATKRIVSSGVEPEDITPELIAKYLYAPDIPAPDLIIRTSGEQRLSNFLLWESAYSELIFSKVYWPDFSEADLNRALREYARRQRRFGS